MFDSVEFGSVKVFCIKGASLKFKESSYFKKKMKILLTIKQLLRLTGFILLKCKGSHQINIIHNLFLFSLLLYTKFSILYFVIKPKDFYNFLDAIGSFANTSICMFPFVYMRMKKDKVIEFFDELESTINERMKASDSIKSIYEKTHSNVEILTSTITSWSNRSMAITFLFAFLTSLFILLFGSDDLISSLQLFIPTA